MSTVTVHREDDWTLVRLSGDLDFESAPRLAEMLALIDGPLVVDCTGLIFVDTAGLRVLVRAVDWHDTVTLRNPSPLMSPRTKSTAGSGVLEAMSTAHAIQAIAKERP